MESIRAIMGTTTLSKMFDGHDPRWKKGKPVMKRLFDVPTKQAMSDYDYMQCQSFVVTTMGDSNFDTDNFMRLVEFLQMIRLSYNGTAELGYNVPWRILKAKFDKDNLFPLFEKRVEKCYVAFLSDYQRHEMHKPTGVFPPEAEWVEFTQEFVRSIA